MDTGQMTHSNNKYQGLIKVSKDKVPEAIIKQELRVFGNGFNNTLLVEDCFKEDANFWYVPIPFAIKHNLLLKSNDNRPEIKVKWPRSEFSPRHNQEKVVNETVTHLKKHSCGRISAPTGFGKTYVALQIGKQLETNILYLVHKTDVLKQVKQIAKQFFKINKCGEIKGQKSETDQLITLCTMQTAAKRVSENPDWLSQFGMSIYDESHRASCNSYIAIMNKVNTKYKLGISATHRRADGLTGVYENYIGELIIEGKKDKPRIPYLEIPRIQGTGITLRDFYDWRGEISHTKAVTKIATNEIFNTWIVKRTLELLEEGRRPIITTDRKEQIEILEHMFHEVGIDSVGVYAGGKHKSHRSLVSEQYVKEEFLKWHKREAIKKFKSKLRGEEKYKKKDFDAQYKNPRPSTDDLETFYKIYEGETLKEKDLAEAITKNVVLATTKKIGEGFDEEMFLDKKTFKEQQPMDTIIITAMTKDSTQIIGRISRSDRAKHPLVIHPIIDIGYCVGIFKKCWKMSYLPVGMIAKDE